MSLIFKKSHEKRTGKIVYFHMNTCGHCKRFNPVWDKFARYAKENRINALKIEAREYRELQMGLGVRGYPTILKLDSKNNKIKEYRGDRSLSSLKAFSN